METFNIDEHAVTKKELWKKHRRNLFAVLAACLGSFSLGAVLGFMTNALPSIIKTHSFLLNDAKTAVAVSFGALGALLGSPIGGQLSDAFGRKSTLCYSTAPFVLGWLMIVAAPNIYCFTAGRVLTSFASGVIDSSLPVYVAEISAAEVRGFMCVILEFNTNLGIQYTYALGTVLSWRWLALACQILPTVMLFLLIFVPESPRWLLKMKRDEECVQNLQWLRGKNSNVDAELNELKSNQITDLGWREFLKPYAYKPFGIVLTLSFLQQLVGMNAVPQYMTEILTAADDHWSPEDEAAIVGAVGVLANFLSALFIDRLGRRVVLLISSFVLILSMTGLTVYFTFLNFGNKAIVSEYSYVVFICLILFTMSASSGIGPVTFVLIAELLPLNVRGRGTGLCTFSMWLIIFIVTFVLPYGVNFIGYYGIFCIFLVNSFVAFLFIFFVIPETKNLTLEEIEKMYSS